MKNIFIKINFIILTSLFINSISYAESYVAVKDKNYKFFESAKDGDIESLKKWLDDKKFNINKTDSKGYTALIYSAYYGKLNAVNYLLDQGADPCIEDKRGNTALLGAIFKGNIAIATKLMFKKCGINQTNNAGQTPMMYASLFGRKEIAKKLLENGANIKLKDSMGNDALTLAESQGNDEMVNIIKKSEK